MMNLFYTPAFMLKHLLEVFGVDFVGLDYDWCPVHREFVTIGWHFHFEHQEECYSFMMFVNYQEHHRHNLNLPRVV